MEYIELKRKAFAVEHKQTRVQRHHEVPEKNPQEREDEELDEGHGLVEVDDKYSPGHTY